MLTDFDVMTSRMTVHACVGDGLVPDGSNLYVITSKTIVQTIFIWKSPDVVSMSREDA